MGGSTHIRAFWPCFARSELWIWTCTQAATDDVSRVHKYRKVRTRTHIEKRLMSPLSWLFHSLHLPSATLVSLVSHAVHLFPPSIYCASLSIVCCWIVVYSFVSLGPSSVCPGYSWPACLTLPACLPWPQIFCLPPFGLFAFLELLSQRDFCVIHIESSLFLCAWASPRNKILTFLGFSFCLTLSVITGSASKWEEWSCYFMTNHNCVMARLKRVYLLAA